MNIQQLRYVVAIANSGTFREAAEKMYVSQPSLSISIKDLETELGFQIFSRTSSGTFLTQKGMDFYEKAQNLVGTLINLKIIRREEQKISVRKKVLKQWTDIELNNKEIEQSKLEQIDTILENLQSDTHQLVRIDNALSDDTDSTHGAQHPLFKNFTKIDPMQMEVIRKLHDLKTDKPKDIYALRDMLEQMFPESDTRLLLKELIEKGYIYWNGYEVTYSHEMYLN